MDVHALGDAPCFGRLADRALLPRLVTRPVALVRHFVAPFHPAAFQWDAKRFHERLVGMEDLVVIRIHDHDIFPNVVEYHGKNP